MNYDLVLTWKNQFDGKWFPIGTLSYKNGRYSFDYTELARRSASVGQFKAFENLEDLNITHFSKELFPIFKNRLLEKSRPELSSYYDWLDLSVDSASPMDELARSGGIRATDSYQLFMVPRKSMGNYTVRFFSHGVRYLAKSYVERLEKLEKRSRLLIMHDEQNSNDVNALALRTEDPPELVGYVPRFFTQDVRVLLKNNDVKDVKVEVEKINLNAPVQYRLLCKLTAPWPDGFEPFGGLKKRV